MRQQSLFEGGSGAKRQFRSQAVREKNTPRGDRTREFGRATGTAEEYSSWKPRRFEMPRSETTETDNNSPHTAHARYQSNEPVECEFSSLPIPHGRDEHGHGECNGAILHRRLRHRPSSGTACGEARAAAVHRRQSPAGVLTRLVETTPWTVLSSCLNRRKRRGTAQTRKQFRSILPN